MNAFFIAGVQRSGTTLLSVILSKHPDIYLDGYSRAFRIITCFNGYYDVLPHNLQHRKEELLAWMIENDYKGMLAELLDYKNIDQYPDIRSLLRASLDQHLKKEGKRLWGDKSPNLQHFIPDLLMLMPEARIIHMVRDGRANAYSFVNRAHKSLSLSAQEWVNGNIFGLANQHLIGAEQYKLVKYEDLLQEPEATVRDVCDFLDVPFAPEMMDLSDDQVPEEQRYVKSSFDASKINRYAEVLTPKQIKKIEGLQAPLLKHFGYELHFPEMLSKYRPLSLARKIFLLLSEHWRHIFRSKRMGMINRQNVEVRIPFKSRIYNFLMKFTQELFSLQIFKALFPRVFYRKKYFEKSDTSPKQDHPVQ
ncbi:MAG: sulfotransferase [Bacteroidota bacterium]